MQNIELKESNLDFRSKEAFKIFRTNVEFSGNDIKVIGITSCTPGEGKSSCSFELAKSYAENGQKVLLVDADLRKSVMRQRHKKGCVRTGLSNYLVGKEILEESICDTDIKNLFLVFAGPIPPNPSELLGSEQFEKMIKISRREFDVIIIDTPPLGSVIDTAVISKVCDGMVIVIESGMISYRFVKKVKEQLSVTGCRILGCVLNKVDFNEKSYYGKYYGKYGFEV